MQWQAVSLAYLHVLEESVGHWYPIALFNGRMLVLYDPAADLISSETPIGILIRYAILRVSKLVTPSVSTRVKVVLKNTVQTTALPRGKVDPFRNNQ